MSNWVVRSALGIVLTAALTACRSGGTSGSDSAPRNVEPFVQAPRPHDPWVFRAVIDERPRCVVVAVGEKLWVAYDGTTGGLVAAMSRPVSFEGAVYTGGHGPQPTTQPPNYEAHAAGATGWRVIDASGQAHAVGLQSYRVDGERSVILRWGLKPPGAAPDFAITERPEFAASDVPGWTRTVQIEGLPAGWSVTQHLGPAEDDEQRRVVLLALDDAEPLGETIEFDRDSSYTLLTTYAPLAEAEHAEEASYD